MKKKRQEKIINLIENFGYMTVSDLAKMLNVSEMTIRRDIIELDKEGKIDKKHGGAKKNSKVLSTNEKMLKNVSEKTYIGKLIDLLITPGDVIYIGAGTTLFYSLDSIKTPYKSILTNSVIAFNYLNEKGFDNLVLTGGEYLNITGEFAGEHAESLFDRYNLNIAFLATNGINNNSITTSYPELGRLQNKIIDSSMKAYIVADHTKFDHADIFTFSTLDSIDGIITDNNISEDILNKYRKYTKIIAKKDDIL